MVAGDNYTPVPHNDALSVSADAPPSCGSTSAAGWVVDTEVVDRLHIRGVAVIVMVIFTPPLAR